METQHLPIKGMHCASCAKTIEKTLKKVEGVDTCEVNFGTEKAKISFDPGKTSLKEMNSKIEPFGYSINSATHTMREGSMINNHEMHEGMDHSEHLGLNQSKEEKLHELKEQKERLDFVFPITITVFALMMWEIAAETINKFPKFFLPHELYTLIMFLLASATLWLVGKPFIEGVTRFLKFRIANMDTLVGIGTLTAYIYSSIIFLLPQVQSLLGLSEYTYFDVTIVVLGFISLGKYLEARSKLKTGEAIEKLINLQAKTALVERDGKEMEVAVEDVGINDIVIVKPGGKIPVDGVIVEGSSSVDESMITGESIPVDKVKDDTVIGGTLNKQGVLKFKATKVGSETLLAHIIKMVEDAQGSRAPIQRLADRISEIFVPVVLVISIITLLGWLIIGAQFMPVDQAFSVAIASFVGVLVIACPCALGLATPTAIIVGTGKGAENGILIKDAESLEKLHKVDTIVTDKTGTITKGEPEVTDLIVLDKSIKEKNVLQIIASLEKNSEHPLALAIVKKAQEENINFLNVVNFQIFEGKGIKGEVGNKEYYVGNLKLISERKLDFEKGVIDSLTKEGKTPVLLANDNKVIAVLAIADTLKLNAKDTIDKLHRLGISVVMLSGDNQSTAEFIAKQAGIDKVVAEVLPNEKSEHIKALQKEGKVVAMIGDGVNDAPALAQADIGIAMGTGTDVAIESAQITLLSGDFSKVVKAIRLSKFTMRAVKQNLFWAFIYNIIGIPLASGLLFPIFGVLLNPVFAGLAMAFSSVSVVANSLRLKLIKF